MFSEVINKSVRSAPEGEVVSDILKHLDWGSSKLEPGLPTIPQTSGKEMAQREKVHLPSAEGIFTMQAARMQIEVDGKLCFMKKKTINPPDICGKTCDSSHKTATIYFNTATFFQQSNIFPAQPVNLL